MKNPKITAMALAVAASFLAQAAQGACVSREEKKWATTGAAGYPWFEKGGIEARGKSVDNIPAAEFDKEWKKASKLTMKSLPAAALEEFKADQQKVKYQVFLQLADANFKIEKDLNNDGKAEKVLAGVFKTAKGVPGGFMAVIDPASTTPGKRVLAVFVYRQKCNFSYLRMAGDEVIWWNCFECDKPQTLVWDGKAFKLKLDNPRDYDPSKTDNAIRQREILK
jgi:hypothetical protein